MPVRAHPTSPAHCQPPSCAAYIESPLRSVQLQSDVKPPRRRPVKRTSSDEVSRRNNSSILQRTLYDALGSSEPVDLLPHVSRRAALSHQKRSDASLGGSLKPPTTENATTERKLTDSAQSPMQAGPRVYSSPRNGAWVLDEALYATPPGCEEAPSGTITSFIRRWDTNR